MLTLPVKTRRKKQPYVAIRSRLFRRQIEKQALLFFSEVRDYLGKQQIEDFGPPFLRFNAFDANGEGDMEFGFFTERQHVVPSPIRSGVLPGGLFTSTTWRGDYDRLSEVNTMLLGWGSMTNVEWEHAMLDSGGFNGCRMAIFHKTSRTEPKPEDWVTELAILHKTAA
jgi:hypothetical protein